MDIRDEIAIPGQEVRHGEAPSWLADSPIWPAVKAQTGDGQLYLHQAMGLELLGQGHNLVISTGTASGKSLVFQAPTLHHLATHPNATAIAIYPIKALARDQVLRWRNMAEAAGVDPAGINRIDGDVRDLTERRQILQRTRLALMTPDVIQQWLMAYSEPLYGRRPLRHDLTGGAEHPVQRAPVPVQPGVPDPGRGPHLRRRPGHPLPLPAAPAAAEAQGANGAVRAAANDRGQRHHPQPGPAPRNAHRPALPGGGRPLRRQSPGRVDGAARYWTGTPRRGLARFTDGGAGSDQRRSRPVVHRLCGRPAAGGARRCRH